MDNSEGEIRMGSARSQNDSVKDNKTGRSSHGINPATDRPYSERTMQDPDTFRTAMSTARAHSAVAALAAQKHALEQRLAVIDAALESEGKRSFHRPRGVSRKSGGTQKARTKK